MERILIIDDDVDICTLLSRFLTRHGFEVDHIFSGKKALEMLKVQKYNLVFCDFRLGDSDGRTILLQIKEQTPDTQVIIITGYSDVKLAVEVIKAGAFDYITKPLLPDEILLLTRRALEIASGNSKDPVVNGSAHEGKNHKAAPKADTQEISRFIEGDSRESKELYRQVDIVAPTSFSVIIYGESGTGKESIALRIHNNSNRASKPFVAVDCGSLTRDLAGSELFGHEKGAFTGAVGSKAGQFELANGGTIFLDEITNLPYDVQVTLLRAVQERKIRRLGGSKETPIDVRIIVASNERLSESASRGVFREDLFHRFNEFSISIPPLRERHNDILTFAHHFLRLANRDLNRSIRGFDMEVEKVFLRYSWPGNLREMHNVVKRAALLTEGSHVQLSALPQEIVYAEKFSFSRAELSGGSSSDSQPRQNLRDAALEAEYEMIMQTLRQVNFNKSKAAQMLNIDRKTLYNKLQHFEKKDTA